MNGGLLCRKKKGKTKQPAQRDDMDYVYYREKSLHPTLIHLSTYILNYSLHFPYLAAAISPGNHSDLDPFSATVSTDQRTTAVSLATASVTVAKADLLVHDLTAPNLTTGSMAHNWT